MELALVICLVVIIWMVLAKLGKNEKAEEHRVKEAERKEQAEQIAHRQQLLNFHQMCTKAGITAIRTEKDLQNATQIASTMQLGDIDVKAFFLEASTLILQEKHAEENQKREEQEIEIRKLRSAEEKKCAELEKYANYSGREKRLAMLRDQYEKAKKNAGKASQDYSTLTTTPLVSRPRDTDWAIHGGIANGLAGPGAGLATAMNIQRQNAENRARADAINSAYVSSLVQSGILEKVSNAEKQYKREAEKLQAQIQEAETALVAEDNADVCFKRLKFNEPLITVSATGTCRVDVNVSLKEEFYIFNGVKATVDGTILAELYDGIYCVGSAKLVLPVWGTRKDAIAYLGGMALFCGQPDKKYTVHLKAENLWAMEAMP